MSAQDRGAAPSEGAGEAVAAVSDRAKEAARSSAETEAGAVRAVASPSRAAPDARRRKGPGGPRQPPEASA